MVYTKTSSVGIDRVIDKLNSVLASKLYTDWSLTDDNSDFFNRVYRNATPEGFKPEGFLSGKNYKDVLLNSSKFCISFFYVSEEPEADENGMYFAEVSNIVQVNLSQAYSGTSHRADEEIRRDLCEFYFKEPLMVKMVGVSTSIDDVFEDFDIETESLMNMQPFLYTKIILTLKYRYQ